MASIFARRLRAPILLSVFCVPALGALWTVWPAFLADLQTSATRAKIFAIQNQSDYRFMLPEWAALRNDLAKGLTLTPEDSLLHEDMAYLYGAYALQGRAIPDLAQDYFKQAFESYRQASRLRLGAAPVAANAGLAAALSARPDLKLLGREMDCRALLLSIARDTLPQRLLSLRQEQCNKAAPAG